MQMTTKVSIADMTLETKVKVKKKSYCAIFNVNRDICDGPTH